MKKLLILIAVLSIVACSTDKRGKQAKAKFENNIWIIDSIITPIPITPKQPTGLVTLIPNTILKPQVDSTFSLYREQFVRYKNYYFSGDSIFISDGNPNYNPLIYRAYKYHFKNDKLVLSSKDELLSDRDLYLTNLTKIFEGKNDISDSTYYKRMKNEAWYLNKFKIADSTIYNINNPEYYLFDWALHRVRDSLHFPYYSSSYPNMNYKFTRNGIYLYDKKNNNLINSFRIYEFQEDRSDFFILRGIKGVNLYNIKFKQIDKSLLKKMEDVPKSYFISCSKEKARFYFLEYLKSNPDFGSYFDYKTIKILQKDDENCEYSFGIIQRNNQFYNMTTQRTYKITFSRNGDVFIK